MAHNSQQQVILQKILLTISLLLLAMDSAVAASIDRSVWAAPFGTLAAQQPYSKSQGYTGKASGAMLAVEQVTKTDDMYGVAFAISNSNLHQTTDNGFTSRLLGYHLILYGYDDLRSDTVFLEWLVTGLSNNNTATTYNQVTTTYNTAQGGFRLNFGQSTENDCWEFSLIETMSYAIFYMPNYHAENSTATSAYDFQQIENLLTIGGGFRVNFTEQNAWLKGVRELHFMGTWDAVTTDKVTSANFLNGISDFTLFSAQGRWSFQVGASYTCTFFTRLQFQFSYDFQLRTKYTDNSAEIKFKYLF